MAPTVLVPRRHCAASTASDGHMHLRGCSTIRVRCGTVRAIPLLPTSIVCMTVEVQTKSLLVEKAGGGSGLDLDDDPDGDNSPNDGPQGR